MNTMPPTIRIPLLAVLATCMLVAATGCHSIDFYDQTLQGPVPPPMEPPRELSMMCLPSYQIEPPDIVQIEMIKQIPLPPYRTEAHDALMISVVGTLLDQPINDFYRIDGEGNVDLGPAYGKLRLAGMTIEETQRAITEHLSQILRAPEVSVQLEEASGVQQLTGVYPIGPDGSVNLRQYGRVHLAGKTIAEAKVALEGHLAQFFDSPEVGINVAEYRSKVYYIIAEGAGLDESVVREQITGNETVLDALTVVGGRPQLSSKDIWIARPAPGGFGCEQILPVDYDAITRGGSSATNYQMLPGDRLFVAEDRLLAATNFVSKFTTPIQRVLGVASLGTSAARGFQTLGRRYALERSRRGTY